MLDVEDENKAGKMNFPILSPALWWFLWPSVCGVHEVITV
jgi:hypothetical protein